MRYFADTYALIEIIKGNKNFKRYVREEIFTSILNLFELYYIILRDFNEELAKKYFFQFKKNLIRFTDEDLFSASSFKLKNVKKRVSYVDSLGYVISLENKMKFLTGDKEFYSVNNVEFVK